MLQFLLFLPKSYEELGCRDVILYILAAIGFMILMVVTLALYATFIGDPSEAFWMD